MSNLPKPRDSKYRTYVLICSFIFISSFESRASKIPRRPIDQRYNPSIFFSFETGSL